MVPLLRGRLGTPYIYAARCESTQRLLTDAEPHGAVAACDEQTAGRGRLGRPWQAPAGTALLCSILLRRPTGLNPAELSVVSALATAETVEHVTSLDARIKWPNDVLLGDRKVAGILLEGRPRTIVLGIGLNVNQTETQLPDRPQFPAGSPSRRTATAASGRRSSPSSSSGSSSSTSAGRQQGLPRSFRTSPDAMRCTGRRSRSVPSGGRRPALRRAGSSCSRRPRGGAWSRPGK